MGAVLLDEVRGFAEGFVTSIEGDKIPPGALPRMRNACLIRVGAGEASLAKRRGMSCMNATPITGSPAVIGQHALRRRGGTTLTQYHLLVSNTGRLDALSTGGTLTTINATAFTSGDYLPDFATANNSTFIVNGQNQLKTDGASTSAFGITAPSTAPTIAVGASGGLHNGTYEGFVTFLNTNTGQESSAGTTSSTVIAANELLLWSAIPVSSDTQVDARNLYIRNTATMTNFYFVHQIPDNTTTSVFTSVADSSLDTPGPDEDENDPPPSNTLLVVAHRSRLFVSDGVDLFYSKVDQVEAFDPEATEPVNRDDGQRITALHSAHDILLIFKGNALYGLYGDDPQSWVVRVIDPDVGCVSHRSVVSVEGRTYWWSEQGPMMWDGASPPVPIGLELIAPTLTADAINFTYLSLIDAEVDFSNQRILFAVPEAGKARLSAILPFNYRLSRWEGIWDPMDIASLGTAEDGEGQPFVFLGNHSGQVFKWWNAENDGVATATTSSGTFTASGTSMTTITDSGATFDTTGGGLIARKVTILDSSGTAVGSTRRYIVSNTGTAFTLDQAVAGLTAAATYTYIIGGPDFDVDTAWFNAGFPFHKKRYEFLHVQARTEGEEVDVLCDLYFSFSTTVGKSLTYTFTTSPEWNVSQWNVAVWDVQPASQTRKRVAKVGQAWKARFRNPYPDQNVALLRLLMTSEQLTLKS